jgi:hypothetical protein
LSSFSVQEDEKENEQETEKETKRRTLNDANETELPGYRSVRKRTHGAKIDNAS